MVSLPVLRAGGATRVLGAVGRYEVFVTVGSVKQVRGKTTKICRSVSRPLHDPTTYVWYICTVPIS